jgi:osmoprotectant transport system substrate-binding protein
MRLTARVIVLLAALALASCGGSGDDSKRDSTPVRIGTTNFAENEILGELYKQALEAKGMRVELQAAIGPREQTILALRGGFIDMYPEYVGVLLSEIHKVTDRPKSPQAAYELAKKLEQPKGFTLLAQTRLSNDNALAVLKSVGLRRHIDSIDDLKRLRRGERVGVAPEFLTRFEGLDGLRRLYGFTPRTKIVDVPDGDQYPELNEHRVLAASVFTTDRQLAGGRYTLLDDPKGVFATNHVAPLISRKILDVYGPQLAGTLDAVSALLTIPVMQELNAKAAKQTPKVVAGEFLRSHGLKK